MTATLDDPTPAEILALIGVIEQRATGAVDAAILVPVQEAIASILGPVPAPVVILERPTGDEATRWSPDDVAACVALAEQFVVDVAGTTDAQRAAMTTVMGRDAFTFVQVLYVVDVLGRLRIGLDRLGLGTPPAASGATSDPDGGSDDLWTLLEAFMQQVARLDALDPLTTELVRLAGARVHDCRLCRSRRSVRALDAAGGAAVFDQVLGGDDASALTERQQVALTLTDALVTQPSTIDDALAAQVRASFTDAEAVELVLDVARNAANKIAVALGADAAVVTDGVEYYDLDSTGTVVADVDIAAVRAATAPDQPAP